MVTGHVERRYNHWVIIVELDRVDGKRKRLYRKASGTTKREAIQEKDAWVAELRGSPQTQSPELTVAGFFRRLLSAGRPKGKEQDVR